MNSHKKFPGYPIQKEVIAIVSEKSLIKTFYVPITEDLPRPGQFYMIWLPTVDEKPISVSIIDYQQQQIGFTVKKVGPFTEKLHQIDNKDTIGIRGPLGNGFTVKEDKIPLLLAGGIGIAPIRSLIDYFHNNIPQKPLNLFYGAHTQDELIFQQCFANISQLKTYYCTDDGTFGYQGFPSNLLDEFLAKSVDQASMYEIYACGPEKFLKAILNISNKYKLLENTQLSVADRYMRCGVGICGSCVIDGLGLSVCKDGPVFSGNLLNQMSDFGVHGRQSDGSKNKL